MAAATDGADLRPAPATFLFTDIESSTRLLHDLGPRFADALADHHRILSEAVTEHGGTVQRTEGDSFFATFAHATDAVAAAADMQRRVTGHAWPEGGEFRVRIGLHTGEALFADVEVIGLDVHRAARIMSAGWGGQIVLSASTLEAADLPDGVTCSDLGEHRLKDLAAAEHLFQADVDGLRTNFPALRSLDAVPNNLPTQLLSFVGRESEVAEAVGLLEDTRLLTLTGPGGTGKTRLSIQVAAEATAAYPGGAFFVALAEVTEPGLVLSSVERELGLVNPSGTDAIGTLAAHVAGRPTLVVLDNFEQVLPAAPIVAELLAAAPDLTIMVTSRAPLRVEGEQEYAVAPLELPEGGAVEDVAASPSVSLFVTRAQAVQPGFAITAGNAAAIADIVRGLDGLPLAIELAAARVKLLPPAALAARLDDRLGILSSGGRDRTNRQRTLRGAIEWSHDLLDEPTRDLFAILSVFTRGANLVEIEAVCGTDLDVLDPLGELLDHSLVKRVAESDDGRFMMLETIREYANERLHESGRAAETADRHLDVYLALVKEAEPHLMGASGADWLARLEPDAANLNAAVTHAVQSGQAEKGLQLVAAAWRFWQLSGRLGEGRRLVDAVLDLPSAAEHPAALASAREAAGGIAYWQADLDASEQHYVAALDLLRELGDWEAVARGLYNLGSSYPPTQPEKSQPRFREALELWERLQDPIGIGRANWGLSVVALRMGEYDKTQEFGQVAIETFDDGEHDVDLAWAMHTVGLANLATGDIPSGRDRLTTSLGLLTRAKNVGGAPLLLGGLSIAAQMDRDFERAVVLWAAAEALQEETGSRLLTYLNDVLAPEERPQVDDELSVTDVERLREAGRALDLAEARAIAEGGALPG